MNHKLTPADQRTLRLIANVLDQQADEETDPLVRFQKRRSAKWAMVKATLPLWLVNKSDKE